MKKYRLNRLFNPISKRCFDVAIDHGFFNEFAFLRGIEDIKAAIQAVVEANPDAIQLTIGQSKYLQENTQRKKPSLVLRADVANVYGASLPSYAFNKMIDTPVIQAVQRDAVCICINLFNIPGAPEVAGQCIDNILKIKPIADYYNMPLMIEPLVVQPRQGEEGYAMDGDIKKILPLVRQAVELGADIVKADPTDDIHEYHRVIEIAGDIPVLVRGGSKASDKEIIIRTKELMNQGASGIVYGRNIIQHANPALITKILMGIVHENMSIKEGMRMVELKS